MRIFNPAARDLRITAKLAPLGWPCAALIACSLSACGSLGVEVWERESLAKPEMQFRKQDLDLSLDDHFYFSKEGSSGGRGFAGGGCGCN